MKSSLLTVSALGAVLLLVTNVAPVSAYQQGGHGHSEAYQQGGHGHSEALRHKPHCASSHDRKCRGVHPDETPGPVQRR
jgi:hypothetical protein